MRYPTFRIYSLLRAWTVLWLIAIPLFHIHPETDPHHGQRGHVHLATVHTVFSGDLDGEFGHHRDAAEGAMTAGAELVLSTESLHAWTADPELGFSLLNDSTDGQSFKPWSTHLLLLTRSVLPVPLRPGLSETGGASAWFPALVVHEIPARAPPSPRIG
jgi:hypothetical protein